MQEELTTRQPVATVDHATEAVGELVGFPVAANVSHRPPSGAAKRQLAPAGTVAVSIGSSAKPVRELHRVSGMLPTLGSQRSAPCGVSARISETDRSRPRGPGEARGPGARRRDYDREERRSWGGLAGHLPLATTGPLGHFCASR